MGPLAGMDAHLRKLYRVTTYFITQTVWKADLETRPTVEPLTLDRVMDIFAADLCRRNVEFRVPSNPLSDQEWMALLLKIYAPAFASSKQ